MAFSATEPPNYFPANVFFQAIVPASGAGSLVGLTNNTSYTFLNNGTFSGSIPGLTNTLPSFLTTAGVSEGNGLYFVPQQAKGVVLQYNIGATQTGLVGGTIQIFTVNYPLGNAPQISNGNPASITFAASGLGEVIFPVGNYTNASITVSGGSGQFAGRWIVFGLFATTWPSPSSACFFQLEWV